MPRFESGKPNQVEEALPHKSPSRLISFARREEMRSEEEREAESDGGDAVEVEGERSFRLLSTHYDNGDSVIVKIEQFTLCPLNTT
ncbi:hypothetical protein PV325_004537 [Microctonus aethiopoides]|nr:hypothetical protein PV325_004537 [Microctonus aethiopoides]